MSDPVAARGTRVITDLPSRLDRLPWSSWHWRVVIALGITRVRGRADLALNGTYWLGTAIGVAPDRVGLDILPFSIGNLLGPILLGPLFDSVGRGKMIAITYAISGLLLAITGWLFMRGLAPPPPRPRSGAPCSSSPPPRRVAPISR